MNLVQGRGTFIEMRYDVSIHDESVSPVVYHVRKMFKIVIMKACVENILIKLIFKNEFIKHYDYFYVCEFLLTLDRTKLINVLKY